MTTPGCRAVLCATVTYILLESHPGNGHVGGHVPLLPTVPSCWLPQPLSVCGSQPQAHTGGLWPLEAAWACEQENALLAGEWGREANGWRWFQKVGWRPHTDLRPVFFVFPGAQHLLAPPLS